MVTTEANREEEQSREKQWAVGRWVTELRVHVTVRKKMMCCRGQAKHLYLIPFVLFSCVLSHLRQGLTLWPYLVWNSISIPGWF